MATLTLFATFLSIIISYLNYRAVEYSSIEDRQRELSKFIDGRTIKYAYSYSAEVRRNKDEFADSLEMNVYTPRVFDRAFDKHREKKELKEKIILRYQNTRYTRVQAVFEFETDEFPDLYDLCVFSNFGPTSHTGDFTSVEHHNGSKITIVNQVSDRHFEIEVISDRPTDVLRALDGFYAAVKTAIVRKRLFEEGRLNSWTKRELRSDLEELIKEFEEKNKKDHGFLTGPALPEDVLGKFQERLSQF